MVLEALEQEGVDLIFGYPGGANLPIYQRLPDHPSSSTSWSGTSRALPTWLTATPERADGQASSSPPPAQGRSTS